MDLVENKFTGSSCAVGFLNPADVKLRSDRTADETITDADAMRSKGNDAFKARDFTAALLSYQASVEALSSYKGKDRCACAGTEEKLKSIKCRT